MAKQKKSNRGQKKQQNRPNRSNNANKLNSNAKFKKRPANSTKAPKGRVQDARQKITQKKRNVVDARDVLAKKAKTQDARSKLDKIRGGQSPKPGNNSNVKLIGNSIVQKVDRNGKISLVTNKSKRNTLQMDMAVKKQLGLDPQSRPQLKRTPPKKPVNPRPNVRRNNSDERYPVARAAPLVPSRSRIHDIGMYKWLKPALRPTADLDTARQAMRDVVREELMFANRGWPNFVAPNPIRSTIDHVRPMRPASRYVDLDAVDEEEEMLLDRAEISRIALRGSSRVSNVHSRLDGAPSQQRSHGILAAETKTKVVVPVGHRIVVSNLESSVTEDDIKELFEDIGQLLSAKMARPGVAEVIFKNLKDAQKAVDTYHNRQLDGQPMKCLLVNKRPLHQPTALPLSKSVGISSRITSASSSVSNKLVPDLSTIHKVLFQRH